MDTGKKRLRYLLYRLHHKTASAAEIEELQQLLESGGMEDALEDLWKDVPAGTPFFSEDTSDAMLKNILHKETNPRPAVHKKAPLLAMAAVVLLTVAAWWYLAASFEKQSARKLPLAAAAVIQPGGDRAVLTLADGSTLVLDSMNNGALAQQGNIRVVKQNGLLAFNRRGSGEAGAAAGFNTLTTPRGGQYMLLMEDGTRVWLNAASSLRFPAVFEGKERKVELKGEAYFEVAPNAAQPFKVAVRGMEVQVLGTHFNVMAYTDEAAVQTTLLEGAVKIHTAGQARLLHPGQQAQLAQTGDIRVVNDVDLEQVIAWKTGLFQFNRADLHQVMRQVARWYDVDIRYEGYIPQREFGGKISRSSSIADVLKILELSKVHFRIEGKTIVVLP
jgi:ferric-dicitrate binding protein FerR (iron transport regulator)